MPLSYKVLDETLGPHIEALFRDPILGQLYHRLVFEIESAQDEFERGSDNGPMPPFRDEYLSKEVRAIYDALRKELRAHHRIMLPCFTEKP